MSIRFDYAGPAEWLGRRSLVGLPVPVFHADAIGRVPPGDTEWVVSLGSELLFDHGGLNLLVETLARASDSIGRATFVLVPDESARREFYAQQAGGGARVELPVTATRAGRDGETQFAIDLPAWTFSVAGPASTLPPGEVSFPKALLFPARSPADVLLANQIGLVCEIERRASASPLAFLRALVRPNSAPTFPQRMGLAFRAVDREAVVHPSAVVEGAVIEKGARIGARACVRFSVVGAGAQVHDGASVVLSVVGRGASLPPDSVLVRGVVEPLDMMRRQGV